MKTKKHYEKPQIEEMQVMTTGCLAASFETTIESEETIDNPDDILFRDFKDIIFQF